MTTKATRAIDAQGRIMIPAHIRQAMNLNQGNLVSLELEKNGTLLIKQEKIRCFMCGTSVERKHHTVVTIGEDEKRICFDCAQTIARAMMK